MNRCRCRRKPKFCSCPASCSTSALATESPQPVAALVEPPDWTWAHLLERHRTKRLPLLVVLAGLQDPGNLGTILRSAEAFGADGVVALPGTVSAWNPKAVRASAGSVFRLPLLAAERRDCFAHLREAGVKSGPPPSSDAQPPTWSTWPGPSRSSSAMKATASPPIWPPRPTAHHHSLPRPGGKPERRRRRRRAALRSLAAAVSEAAALDIWEDRDEPLRRRTRRPQRHAAHRAAGRAHAPPHP